MRTLLVCFVQALETWKNSPAEVPIVLTCILMIVFIALVLIGYFVVRLASARESQDGRRIAASLGNLRWAITNPRSKRPILHSLGDLWDKSKPIRLDARVWTVGKRTITILSIIALGALKPDIPEFCLEYLGCLAEGWINRTV